MTVRIKRNQPPRSVRIGTGAGFSGDRLAPAIVLAERGRLDYLVLECLAERTIAIAHKAKLNGDGAGYDPWLEERFKALLPACSANGTRIITNMGAASPVEAARRAVEIAAELGLGRMKVAAVIGDDVLDEICSGNAELREKDAYFPTSTNAIVSANAYIGAFSIVDALEQGADVVIAGRVADPAMFLAPLIHEYGWSSSDWHELGCGTAVGHLMECAGQISGGYFADPGRKDVPDLFELGYPIADVYPDGTFVITKVPGTGGVISEMTCVEQLLYEVHDPAAYIQPDVIADFSEVRFQTLAPGRIRVTGATGRERTATLKVSVGYRASWKGEGQISYYGANSIARANQAAELIKHWFETDFPDKPEHLIELIGIPDTSAEPIAPCSNGHVRVRFVARMPDERSARWVGRAVETLYLNGPAGGGGVSASSTEIIGIASALIPREQVHARVQMMGVSS